MTYFDYFVLFILICSVVVSAFNGLVREGFSLLGWVAGFIVANAYGEQLAVMLPAVVSGQTMRLIVAFVVLFISTRLAVALFARAVSVLIKSTGLTKADRGLGALLGLAKGMVIVLTAVLLCGMTAVPQQPFWKNAMFSPLAETAARTVMPFLPLSVSQRIRF